VAASGAGRAGPAAGRRDAGRGRLGGHHWSSPHPARRPSISARRARYLVVAVIDAALVYLVNVWPGWQAVRFLTADTRQLLGLVNLSLVAGLVVNLVYIIADPSSHRRREAVAEPHARIRTRAPVRQLHPAVRAETACALPRKRAASPAMSRGLR
jgi:hypothetical protein